MEPIRNTVSEPAGIWKPDPPRLRSMTSACATENVVIWAWMVQNMMVVAQIGSIRTTCFTSSTSVRVFRVHLLAVAGSVSGAMMAAWSRNLFIVHRVVISVFSFYR
ncbi:hypothetical protein PR202_gb07407 [Eleusine coracana subsp. coracana]|uniref:Uncharacterized protein n=1 Tax=Eleusine coracana subsp. coracana TaxID=191504 RepID=A0AAV5EAE0_ELECO|nr:hypothetical protein PR202_gb07407 [Eleusine coracana subsp. coracana]